MVDDEEGGMQGAGGKRERGKGVKKQETSIPDIGVPLVSNVRLWKHHYLLNTSDFFSSKWIIQVKKSTSGVLDYNKYKIITAIVYYCLPYTNHLLK